MTALPGWPAVSGAATFQHIRRGLAGQFARNAAGALRKGILPHTTAALVTGTATMNVAVAQFVAVLDRNGAILLANDGSVNVLLSSAPASGSRWSVVYVKQRETEAPFSDGVAGPIIDKVESITSEAAARALLPAGALELAVVQVNAGAANTNAVGVTITQTFPFTTSAGGMVWVRNNIELQAWTPADGSFARRIDNEWEYERVAGAWVPVASPWTDYACTWAAASSAPAIGNGSLVARYRYIGRDTIAVRLALTFGSTTSGGTGAWTLTLPSGITSMAGSEQQITCKAYLAGPGLIYGGVAQVNPGGTFIAPNLPLNNSVPSLGVAQNASSGGAAGTGIPLVSGQYSFANGSNLVIEGVLEID